MIGALFRWWRARRREVRATVFPHYYPNRGSYMELSAGPDRCFYCLRHDPDHVEYTKPACSRRRPCNVELA